MRLRLGWRNSRFSLSIMSGATKKTLFSSEFETDLRGDPRSGAVFEYLLYIENNKLPTKMQLTDMIAEVKNGKIIRKTVSKKQVKCLAYLIQNSLVTGGQDMVLERILHEMIDLTGKRLHLGTRIIFVNEKVFPDMVRIK
jgi:hypothetical protein